MGMSKIQLMDLLRIREEAIRRAIRPAAPAADATPEAQPLCTPEETARFGSSHATSPAAL